MRALACFARVVVGHKLRERREGEQRPVSRTGLGLPERCIRAVKSVQNAQHPVTRVEPAAQPK